jgi:hypothetical protein
MYQRRTQPTHNAGTHLHQSDLQAGVERGIVAAAHDVVHLLHRQRQLHGRVGAAKEGERSHSARRQSNARTGSHDFLRQF